jgi:hypothetical protein
MRKLDPTPNAKGSGPGGTTVDRTPVFERAGTAPNSGRRLGSRLPRSLRIVGAILLVVGCSISALSWYFTPPLEAESANDVKTSSATHKDSTTADRDRTSDRLRSVADSPIVWPSDRLEGLEAKRLLLRVMIEAGERIDRVRGLTAIFHKRERIDGKLGPMETMRIKVRSRPFSVYLKYLHPSSGKEVIYVSGKRDNKLIGHYGGASRMLLPRIVVPPDHPVALASSRHPITEAGPANLIKKLIKFRQIDLNDDRAVTILDRGTDFKGRIRPRSLHRHPEPDGVHLYAEVEIFYDPETFIPYQITNYGWREGNEEGPLPLVEMYRYDELAIDVPLTDLDFDPANPAYEFRRF